MEFLLAILVWLGVLTPGQQITTTQYDSFVQSNSTAIQQIAADTLLSQQAVTAYNNGTQLIVIDPLSR
jgi:hypothetical protein